MRVNEVINLKEARLPKEIPFMGWMLRPVPKKTSFDGVAYAPGKERIVIRGVATLEEVYDQLKQAVREKRSTDSQSRNPNIQFSNVDETNGVFNQAFTNSFFGDEVPALGKIVVDGATHIDVYIGNDPEDLELYKSDGFVQISDRLWNKSRVYRMSLTPKQVADKGLEFRGIYTVNETKSPDPDLKRFTLSPQPIDYLEGKESKKIFKEPTFSIPTWLKGSKTLQERDASMSYETVEVKGIVDRVIAKIKNQKGSAWTRMGKQLKDLRNQIAVLSEKEAKLTDKIKDRFPETFDSSDEVLTRVVETAHLVATMTKASQTDKSTVDYAAILEEILKLDLVPEQQKAVTAIIKKHTTTKTVSTPSKLRLKVTESELMANIKSSWSSLLSKLKVWGKRQDQKIARVKQMMSQVGSNQNTMISEEEVMSSWIDELTYEPHPEAEGEGNVEMLLGNGRAYTVYNVAYGEYEDWLSSPSKGRYWHANIKDVYTVR